MACHTLPRLNSPLETGLLSVAPTLQSVPERTPRRASAAVLSVTVLLSMCSSVSSEIQMFSAWTFCLCSGSSERACLTSYNCCSPVDGSLKYIRCPVEIALPSIYGNSASRDISSCVHIARSASSRTKRTLFAMSRKVNIYTHLSRYFTVPVPVIFCFPVCGTIQTDVGV